MEFCSCGGILEPLRKAKGGIALTCRACGKVSHKKITSMKITSAVKEGHDSIVVVGKGETETTLPKIRMLCPKCEHEEAYWWTQQTRAMDEPQTRFFRCTKCNYTWRDYE